MALVCRAVPRATSRRAAVLGFGRHHGARASTARVVSPVGMRLGLPGAAALDLARAAVLGLPCSAVLRPSAHHGARAPTARVVSPAGMRLGLPGAAVLGFVRHHGARTSTARVVSPVGMRLGLPGAAALDLPCAAALEPRPPGSFLRWECGSVCRVLPCSASAGITAPGLRPPGSFLRRRCGSVCRVLRRSICRAVPCSDCRALPRSICRESRLRRATKNFSGSPNADSGF